MTGSQLDYVVFGLWLAGAIAAFAWRKSRNRLLYWGWLGLTQIEIAVRKRRDRKLPPDQRGI